VQYTWDTVLGKFDLITADDAFQTGELFNIEFELVVQNAGSPPAQELFTDVMIVTGTTALTGADIGKKIVIKGASPYFEVSLPEGATVAEKTVTYFEWGVGSHVNVKLTTFAGDTIDWGKGNLDHITGGVCESLALFWEASVGEWRVHSHDGNFLKLGRIISTDGDDTTEYNVQEMDGSNLAVATYKRAYEDYVQQLPPAQVCNYADWGTGDNSRKWSYSNGTNFRVPDRRNLYLRNTDGAILPGVYQADMIGPLSLVIPQVQHIGSGVPVGVTDGPLGGSPPTETFTISAGTETRPKSVVVRQFVLI